MVLIIPAVMLVAPHQELIINSEENILALLTSLSHHLALYTWLQGLVRGGAENLELWLKGYTETSPDHPPGYGV